VGLAPGPDRSQGQGVVRGQEVEKGVDIGHGGWQYAVFSGSAQFTGASGSDSGKSPSAPPVASLSFSQCDFNDPGGTVQANG